MQLLASTEFPVLLMPVKLETRFVKTIFREQQEEKFKHELWVRIFPDEVFLNSFDPRFTNEEVNDRVKFVTATQSTQDFAKENAWKYLVSKYGVYRASWIIHAEEKYWQSSDSEFKGFQSDEEELDFYYQWLPDYFVLYLYSEDSTDPRTITIKKKIDRAGLGIFINTSGEIEQVSWINDFGKAIEAGMGIKILLRDNEKKFKKIIAVGLRKEKVAPSAEIVKELLYNHQYTQGFSFLDFQTPTNNLGSNKSGFSSRDEFDDKGSYPYAVQALDLKSSSLSVYALNDEDRVKLENLKIKLDKLEDGLNANPNTKDENAKIIESIPTFAKSISEGLGFNVEDFKHIQHANLQLPRLHFLIQKATWFALGGDVLKKVFGNNIDSDAHEFIWQFYYQHVQNRGPYPAIKIGDIPYGILPVSHWKSILDETDINTFDLSKKLRKMLAFLGEEWLKMAESKQERLIPRMDKEVVDRDGELAAMLSMSPTSTYLQLRVHALERMKGKLPEWLARGVTTPQSIYSYPPLLVDELLKGKQGYDRDFESARQESKEITKVFGDFLSDEQTVNYAPHHTFKEVGVTDFDNLDFPITLEDDWYKTDFLKRVEEILDGKESFIYTGKTNFLLYELLNSSRVNALGLYNQHIYFNPTGKEEVQNIQKYTLHTSPQQQLKIDNKEPFDRGEIIATLIATPGNRTIKIKAPISGIIERSYLSGPNKTVKDKQRLFRIKNIEKYDAIDKKMGALFAQIIIEIERLRVEGSDHIEAQRMAIMEAMDLSSFRLDAWITGLAQSRLLELRKSDQAENKQIRKGFYYGAYGWVEELELAGKIAVKNEITGKEWEDDNVSDGGIIHAPSSAQAITAAMFRQSFSAYNRIDDNKKKKPNPFTLNLTSDRIQRGQQLMDGLRGGQDLEALLGYKFERFLHEYQQDALIYELRRSFPLEVNKVKSGLQPGLPTMTVVNGLKLIKEYKGNESIVLQGIDLLKNILDGSTDILLYEAGFQMIQGNYSQSAAAMDAAKGKLAPPKTIGLNTPIPSTGLVHKLIMLLDAPENPPSTPSNNPKAFMTPVLEHWLKEIIGDLEGIKVIVTVHRLEKDLIREEERKVIIATLPISMDRLEIGHLDLLMMGQSNLNNDATELEQRILQIAKKDLKSSGISWSEDLLYEIRDSGSNLSDLLIVLQYINDFLKTSRHLTTEDIAAYEDFDENESGSRMVTYDKQDLATIKGQLKKCVDHLRENPSLEVLAKYNMENAKSMFSIMDATEQNQLEERTRKEVRTKATQADDLLDTWKEDMGLINKVNLLESVKNLLFGKSFPLMIPYIPTASFKKNLVKDQFKLIGDNKVEFPDGTTGGQEKIRQWIEGRTQVNSQTETFSDFLMTCENWSPNLQATENTYLKDWSFRVVQYSPSKDCPWTALDKSSSNQLLNKAPQAPYDYPKDSQSIVIYTPFSNIKNTKQYGLFIDQFSEKIPDQKVNTGVAFQYNAPNTEAPQAILLAVPADTSEDVWVEDALRDIVNDTIDLTKIRMIDTYALQNMVDANSNIKQFNSILPMAFWQKLPNQI